MSKDNNEIIIYQSDDGLPNLSVRIENENVWLTQRQICELFQTAKSTVSEHIKNIYDDEELQPEATVRKIRTVQIEGSREVERNLEHYNLDMIAKNYLSERELRVLNNLVSAYFDLAELETLNAHLIQQELPQPERLRLLNQTAIQQMRLLTDNKHIKQLEGGV